MIFDLDPQVGVNPIPVSLGMDGEEARVALEKFFGMPAKRYTSQYRGDGWWLTRADYDTTFFYHVDHGKVTAVEAMSSAVIDYDRIAYPNQDDVRFRGIEVFNADPYAVVAAIIALGLSVFDDSHGQDMTSVTVPELGFELARESSAFYGSSPDTPWVSATISPFVSVPDGRLPISPHAYLPES